MPGDYSRKTFDPRKQFAGVLMQQGRVQLDADWNEQQAINRFRQETETRDVIGSCGAPLVGGGFRISPIEENRDLRISPGRIYVHGILCQLDAEPVPATVLSGSPSQVQIESIYVDGYPLETGHWIELFEQGENLSSPPGPLGVFRVSSVDEAHARITLEGELSGFESSPPRELNLRRVTTFLTQPDYPNPVIDGAISSPPGVVSSPPGQLNLPAGVYLAYLDVWQREVTALDDPRIREVALGGPDTAARLKTVCQVRLLEVASSSPANLACTTDFPEWEDLIASSSGRLNARTKIPSPDDDPCELPPSAGYRRLENQLYRVQVHQGGTRAQATFKWSRDNASVEAKILEIDPTDGARVAVSSVGKDEVLGFQPGQWVEIIDDDSELKSNPHPLVRIADVFPGQNLIVLEEDISFHIGAARKLRRWDQTDPVNEHGVIGLTEGDAEGWVDLEGGIQIQFQDGTYRSGDYWLIPARTVSGEIEWPPFQTPNLRPIPQAPRGVHHHYCRLALIEAAADGSLTIHDCRCRLPSLNQTQGLYYVSGDGQEVMPPFPSAPDALVSLPQPLVAGLVNSHCREHPAKIRFTVLKGTGRVKSLDETISGAQIDLSSDETGLVECLWDLGAGLASDDLRDQNLPSQQVQAQLLDENDEPVHLPLRFNANLSLAEQVAFDPGACPHLENDNTVQSAIDKLAGILTVAHQSGEGQQAPPGEWLPQTLEVRVFNKCGQLPDGLSIEFVPDDGGQVSETGPVTPGASSVQVAVGADGIAGCFWRLNPDPARPSQQLRASLVDPSGELIVQGPAFAVFTAHHSSAGLEPGIHVEALRLNVGRDLVNDTDVAPDELARGLQIICDEEIDQESARGKPVCFVTLELPYPFNDADFELWGSPVIGFQPLVLRAEVNADNNVIFWTPAQETQIWLLQQLFPRMTERRRGDRLLARLTVQGNFVWARTNPDLFLDGEVFGLRRDPDTNTSLRFPSGDGRRGGNLEMWFWLTQSQPAPTDFTISATASGSLIIGAIRDVSGNPVSGVTVNLTGPVTRATSTNAAGNFQFPNLPQGSYRVSAVIGGRSVEQNVVVPGGSGGNLLDPRNFPNARLADVSGIGNVSRARLEERGIDHPALVASIEPEVLSEILGITPARARTLIENARRTLEV
jgi:hypothetical protein